MGVFWSVVDGRWRPALPKNGPLLCVFLDLVTVKNLPWFHFRSKEPSSVHFLVLSRSQETSSVFLNIPWFLLSFFWNSLISLFFSWYSSGPLLVYLIVIFKPLWTMFGLLIYPKYTPLYLVSVYFTNTGQQYRPQYVSPTSSGRVSTWSVCYQRSYSV